MKISAKPPSADVRALCILTTLSLRKFNEETCFIESQPELDAIVKESSGL